MREPRAFEASGVRNIRREDFERVIDTLARAFDDDPMANFLVKQDARRQQRIRRDMHGMLTRLTFPFGETYVTEGFEGAALWTPPGRGAHGLRHQLWMLSETLSKAGMRKFLEVAGALNRVDQHHPEAPHYYLAMIGVDPPYQGQGIGSRLMAPMLERCDREGMPVYLESSKERNIPLYERHGFRVTGEIELAPGGPTLWPMWREPR